MNNPRYSLIIRWSEEDQCYIAWIPEFGPAAKTHGSSIEEAARMGQEVLDMLLDSNDAGRPDPGPWLYVDSDSDAVIGQELLPNNAAYRVTTSASRTA